MRDALLPSSILALLLCSACAGCPPTTTDAVPDDAGAGGDARRLTGEQRLLVAPQVIELVTDGDARPEVPFAVHLVESDGSTRDVTDRAAIFLDDPQLAEIDDGVVRSRGRLGETTLSAFFDDLSARVPVISRLHRDVVLAATGGALPDDAAALFRDAPEDASRAPVVVYPNDGVLLPSDLGGGLEVHFRPASSNETVFLVAFESDLFHVGLLTRCAPLGGGCVAAVPDDVFAEVASRHRGRAPARLVVRATDDEGAGQGASAPVAISIAPAELKGGLYYWTTSNDPGIMRVDLEAAEPAPERFFPFEGTECFGCHAVSPDGRRMTVSKRTAESEDSLGVVDIAEESLLVAADGAATALFTSWNPASSRFAAIDAQGGAAGRIDVREAEHGEVVETILVGGVVTHPEWSPVRDRIFFVTVGEGSDPLYPRQAGISFVDRVQGVWSAPVALVPATSGRNRTFPTASPDGALVVYGDALCPPGELGVCDGVGDETTALWAVPASGGAPVELAAANAPGIEDGANTALSSTGPRFAPFVATRTAEGAGRLLWLTFASQRAYGLHGPAQGQRLWMVGVDPERIEAGEDGSFAAFCLPFQDLSTSNHSAQWTREIVKRAEGAGVP